MAETNCPIVVNLGHHMEDAHGWTAFNSISHSPVPGPVDADTKTMLAQMMLRLARQLDPELVSAKWN